VSEGLRNLHNEYSLYFAWNIIGGIKLSRVIRVGHVTIRVR
jgi:hypothetical protein